MKSGFIYRILAVIVGLLIGLVLLELGLRACGWTVLFIRDLQNDRGSGNGGQYRIMCIGGSTTASGGPDSYPSQLEGILNSSGLGVGFKVINAGVDGQNSRAVLLGLKDNLDRWKPDMVVALVGNNDGEEAVSYGTGQGREFVPEKESFFESFRVFKLWVLLSDRVRNRLSQINWHLESFRDKDGNVGSGSGGTDSVPDPERVKASDLAPDEQLPETDMALAPDAAGLFGAGKSKLPPELQARVQLAHLRNLQHRYEDACRILETEVFPQYPDDYGALSVYANAKLWLEDNEAALRARRRLLELEPGNPDNYYLYAVSVRRYYHSAEARDMLEKAITLQPGNVAYHTHLCTILRTRGERYRLHEVIRGALSRNLRHHVLFGYAATCSLEQGNMEDAKKYYKMANDMRLRTYSPQTRFNYPRIIDEVVGRGLKMVCAQDPVVGVEPLMKVLDYRSDVIYVDNEKVFKDRLFNGTKYSELFIDNFGGEFGHATREGNRILASSIARRIIEECFSGKKKRS